MYYPMMLDLKEKKITIIGGGKIAYRKALHFLEFEGKVTLVSETFIAEFEAVKDRLTLICSTYREDVLYGSFIVVAATNDKGLNRAIGRYCKAQNILCNIASESCLSSFIMPTYIKRGNLIISISTGGSSPALAKKIKEKLALEYDASYEEYTEFLRKAREKILQQPINEAKKAEILTRLTKMTLEELKDYLKLL